MAALPAQRIAQLFGRLLRRWPVQWWHQVEVGLRQDVWADLGIAGWELVGGQVAAVELARPPVVGGEDWTGGKAENGLSLPNSLL